MVANQDEAQLSDTDSKMESTEAESVAGKWEGEPQNDWLEEEMGEEEGERVLETQLEPQNSLIKHVDADDLITLFGVSGNLKSKPNLEETKGKQTNHDKEEMIESAQKQKDMLESMQDAP